MADRWGYSVHETTDPSLKKLIGIMYMRVSNMAEVNKSGCGIGGSSIILDITRMNLIESSIPFSFLDVSGVLI